MRASRLLSILILLQLRQRLTASELAAAFEVSVRTIYRDIDALSAAGIPVYGDAGPGGGFALLEGYRTRLTGLQGDETEAMLLIGLPDAARAMGLGTAAVRARDKLLSALPGSGGDQAARIAGCFHVDTVEWYRAARPVPLLAAVARAVLDRRMLSITYQSWTQRRAWQVAPWGLVLKAGNWYLVGHAGDRTMTFNVADIETVEPLAEGCAVPASFDLAQWWAGSIADFERRLRPGVARLRASPLGLTRLRLLGSFAGEAVGQAGEPDAAGWREVALPLESIAAAAPMLLGIGPELNILDPPALRQAVGELARAVAARMEEGG